MDKGKLKVGITVGSVVKSLSAGAGDRGVIPGLGGLHMPQSNWAHAPQLLSLCYEAHTPRAYAPQQKSQQWEAHALRLENSPHLPQLEKPEQ